MKIVVRGMVLLTVVLASAGNLRADVITINPDTGVGADSAERATDNGTPSAGAVGSIGAYARSSGGGLDPNSRKTWIRFDIDNSLGSGWTIDDATLSFSLSSEGSDGGVPGDIDQVRVYGLLDGDAGESWDDTTLTWANAPANDTGDPRDVVTSRVYGGTWLGKLSRDTGPDPDVFSLSNATLVDFLNEHDSNGHVTFILTGNVETNADNWYRYFYGSDSGAAISDPTLKPALELTFTIPPVPEPAGLGLLALGGAAMAAGKLRRRRRG